jgi:hypothetical protein
VYRIDGRSDPSILLRFYQRDFVAARERLNSVTASVQVTLCDAQGHVQQSANIPLSTAGWGESQGLFGVYLGNFHFDRNASYILRVSYMSGSVPPLTKQVYFSIDNCAVY